VYHVAADQEGLTLSAAMKELCAPVTWGQAKKWIAKRHVQVNGNLCVDAARRVSAKDVIKLWKDPLPKPVDVKDIRLAYFDEHLLVVEKPAGLTSVRHFDERKISTRRRQLQPTLEELLPPVLAKIQRLRWPPLPPAGMNRGKRNTNLKRGQQSGTIHNAKKLPQELRVFPVHRLDRDTSGLMLFARTRAAEQKLVDHFRRHLVRREYLAFCIGHLEPQTIRTQLVRDRGDGVRGSLKPTDNSDAEQGLPAVTHVVSAQPVVSRPDGATISAVRCRLETGRTHQIRIHLSEAGHPICGDKTYCRLPNGSIWHDATEAPRQALHSDRLAFTHPFTGQRLAFEMPLPSDLANWLKRLSSKPE
jgi:23S rRNA pseudouridine1911/1915/1917 synthase